MLIGTIDDTIRMSNDVILVGISRYRISVDIKDEIKPIMIFITTME